MMLPETKVYLAARFGRQQELRGYRDQLEMLGIGCTSRWLHIERDGGECDPEQLSLAAAQNLADIAAADAVVCFTDLEPGSGRGGHHVEFGYALGMAHLVLVGPRVNVFHHLAAPRLGAVFETAHEWLSAWTELRGRQIAEAIGMSAR